MNNTRIFTVQELPFNQPQKKSSSSDWLQLKRKIIIPTLVLLFVVFFLILLVTVITLILIFALNKQPNLNVTCAQNSTKNGTICICDQGFAGDGVNFCDGN